MHNRSISLATFALFSILLLLPGCFTTRAATSLRTSPAQAAPPESWPARDRAPVEALHRATPSVIPQYELAPGTTLESLSAESKSALDRPEAFVRFKGLLAGGLLRVIERPAPDPESAEIIARFENLLSGGFHFNASFITSCDVTGPRWERHIAEHRSLLELRKSSRTIGPQSLLPVGTADELAIDEGIRIAVPPPRPASAPHPRGLILHYTTLMPNEYERRTIEALSADGWVVVSFETRVRIDMPRDAAALAQLPALQARYQELSNKGTLIPDPSNPEAAAQARAAVKEAGRIYIRIYDIQRGWFTLCSADQIDALARQIAAAVDNSTADNAYAAEAVLQYLAAERPDIPQSPLAIVGMSAGALAAPTVAARLGPRVNAVVLVGGAADMLTVSLTSDLKKTGAQLRCTETEPAPADLIPPLTQAYLTHSRLDAYATAPLLVHTPVLLINAANDTVVPTVCGELLSDRLQNPDRRDFVGTIGVNAGHMELFYLLPRQGTYIARWLRDHTRTQ